MNKIKMKQLVKASLTLTDRTQTDLMKEKGWNQSQISNTINGNQISLTLLRELREYAEGALTDSIRAMIGPLNKTQKKKLQDFITHKMYEHIAANDGFKIMGLTLDERKEIINLK